MTLNRKPRTLELAISLTDICSFQSTITQKDYINDSVSRSISSASPSSEAFSKLIFT